MKTININITTLEYDDFIKVRNTKIGDIVTLSDGESYKVVENETKFGGNAHMSMDIIPYGSNDTYDNK